MLLKESLWQIDGSGCFTDFISNCYVSDGLVCGIVRSTSCTGFVYSTMPLGLVRAHCLIPFGGLWHLPEILLS